MMVDFVATTSESAKSPLAFPFHFSRQAPAEDHRPRYTLKINIIEEWKVKVNPSLWLTSMFNLFLRITLIHIFSSMAELWLSNRSTAYSASLERLHTSTRASHES